MTRASINPKNDLKISLVKHSTAKDIVISFYASKFPKITNEEELLNQYVFTWYKGKKKNIKIKDRVKEAEKNNVWGYCQHYHTPKQYKEIHFWRNSKATRNRVIEFLGHELAHVMGYKNELTASKIGAIAVFSAHLQNSIFIKKQKKGSLALGK